MREKIKENITVCAEKYPQKQKLSRKKIKEKSIEETKRKKEKNPHPSAKISLQDSAP